MSRYRFFISTDTIPVDASLSGDDVACSEAMQLCGQMLASGEVKAASGCQLQIDVLAEENRPVFSLSVTTRRQR